MISRRQFVKQSLSIATCAAGMNVAQFTQAKLVPVPLGLELYSLRDQLPQNFDAVLNQVASLGYREVEAASFFGRSAAEVKRAMQSAGLSCVSALYPTYDILNANLDEILRYSEAVGVKFIGCASAGRKDATSTETVHLPHNLADWRWSAEQFNRIGSKIRNAGFEFCYHNHIADFKVEDGVLPYDELLRLTDPTHVTMELDCGWMIVGGQSPVRYLLRCPTRFSLLHVKDFKPDKPITSNPPPNPTELGRGSIDYVPILEAADKAHIRHCFVEQEGFDRSPWESLRIDADFMRNLTL